MRTSLPGGAWGAGAGGGEGGGRGGRFSCERGCSVVCFSEGEGGVWERVKVCVEDAFGVPVSSWRFAGMDWLVKSEAAIDCLRVSS